MERLRKSNLFILIFLILISGCQAVFKMEILNNKELHIIEIWLI